MILSKTLQRVGRPLIRNLFYKANENLWQWKSMHDYRPSFLLPSSFGQSKLVLFSNSTVRLITNMMPERIVFSWGYKTSAKLGRGWRLSANIAMVLDFVQFFRVRVCCCDMPLVHSEHSSLWKVSSEYQSVDDIVCYCINARFSWSTVTASVKVFISTIFKGYSRWF